MHLATRTDDDQGRTRTVVWNDGSITDLGALVAAAIATIVFIASVIGAIELRGVPRTIAVVLAVISGCYAAMLAVPLAIIFAVTGMAAKQPSTGQRASWVIAAAALGALVGCDTYLVGGPGLLAGPIVIAIAVAVVGARPARSGRTRRRVLALSSVTAVVALGVGLTIFL